MYMYKCYTDTSLSFHPLGEVEVQVSSKQTQVPEAVFGRGGLQPSVEGVRKTGGEVGLEESTRTGEDHVTSHVTNHVNSHVARHGIMILGFASL